MYRLGLNQAKSNNYMFFDFEAPLCLSVTKNTGVVERLTPSILSAIKSKTLILLEGELPNVKGSSKVEVEEEKVTLEVMDEEIISRVTVTDGSIRTSFEKAEEEVEHDLVNHEAPEKEVNEEIVEETVEEKPKKAVSKRAPKKAKAE